MRRTEWTALLGEAEGVRDISAIAILATGDFDRALNSVRVSGWDLGLVGHARWVASDLGGFGSLARGLAEGESGG